MAITVSTSDNPAPKVEFEGKTASGDPALIGGAAFTIDDALGTFQLTGDGKSAIFHPTVPGTTTIRATAVNVLGQTITATPETLIVTGPVAVGGIIVKL
jgi:hypothetical protein